MGKNGRIHFNRRKMSLAEHRLVSKYLTQIANFQRLSHEEQDAVFRAVALGDAQAQQIAIESNLNLVITVAKSYCGKGLELDDLIQHGNLGLMEAVKRFNLSFNCRFSTYAVYWIRQAIRQGIMNEGKTVRIPVSAHDSANELFGIIQALTQHLERAPTSDELMQASGLSRQKIQSLLKARVSTASVDAPLLGGRKSRGHEESSSLGVLCERRTLTPTHHLQTLEIIEGVQADISFLLGVLELSFITKRDRDVFKVYNFSSDSKESRCTLDSVANLFDLTRERVRQIIKRIWQELQVLESPIANSDDLFRAFAKIEDLQKSVDVFGDPRHVRPKVFSPQEIKRFEEKIDMFRHPKKK
jgi:RNA polymerase primary sigma factor